MSTLLETVPIFAGFPPGTFALLVREGSDHAFADGQIVFYGDQPDIILKTSEDVSAHGGAVIIDALARDFGLWNRIKALPLPDQRSDKSCGFSPEVIVAQIIFSFCTGGISIEDAGRLANDTALVKLVGFPAMASSAVIALWLNRQSPAGRDVAKRARQTGRLLRHRDRPPPRLGQQPGEARPLQRPRQSRKRLSGLGRFSGSDDKPGQDTLSHRSRLPAPSLL